jgi:hypothetical protein
MLLFLTISYEKMVGEEKTVTIKIETYGTQIEKKEEGSEECIVKLWLQIPRKNIIYQFHKEEFEDDFETQQALANKFRKEAGKIRIDVSGSPTDIDQQIADAFYSCWLDGLGFTLRACAANQDRRPQYYDLKYETTTNFYQPRRRIIRTISDFDPEKEPHLSIKFKFIDYAAQSPSCTIL